MVVLMTLRNRAAARATCMIIALSCVQYWASAASPGVTDKAISFGQIAPFSGPNGNTGVRYHAGIQAAFRERNDQGGVNGRSLNLVSLDNASETEKAAEHVGRFVAEGNMFAVIGGMGTRTSRRIAPLLRAERIPFVGLFTGADILRNRERYPNVVNLRASYFNEIEVLVDHMVNKLGKRRFGVIYQDDAFGRSILGGYRSVLGRYGLPVLAKSSFSPNTHAVHSSLFTLAKADLDAVLLAGSNAAIADAINLAGSLGQEYVMANLSVVASHDLFERLDDISERSLERILVTEVVPDPEDSNSQVVKRFQSAIEGNENIDRLSEGLLGLRGRHLGDTVALEGYLIGRFVIEVLSRIDGEPTRETFLSAALQSEPVHIDDWTIQIAPGTNTGSTYVRLINLADFEHSSGDHR